MAYQGGIIDFFRSVKELNSVFWQPNSGLLNSTRILTLTPLFTYTHLYCTKIHMSRPEEEQTEKSVCRLAPMLRIGDEVVYGLADW